VIAGIAAEADRMCAWSLLVEVQLSIMALQGIAGTLCNLVPCPLCIQAPALKCKLSIKSAYGNGRCLASCSTKESCNNQQDSDGFELHRTRVAGSAVQP
jgi:hypothetical protein